MFAKQSLKNRFKSLESKLSSPAVEKTADAPASLKALHPEIHACVKNHDAPEEDLSHYLRSIKDNFNRITISEASENNLAFENEISNLINSFTKSPCLIQVIHPQDKRGLENFKNLILALNDSDSQWRLLFKDQTWVGVNFASSMAFLTFDQYQMESSKLEGLLKTISSKSNHLLSFNIQKKDSQFMIGLRLEANIIKKISTERDTAL